MSLFPYDCADKLMAADMPCRRWLVHSLADYYGLRAWSVTQGDPARREAYVGIRSVAAGKPVTAGLPRPLWGIV